MLDELVRLPDDVVFENVYPVINKVITMYLAGEVDKVVKDERKRKDEKQNFCSPACCRYADLPDCLQQRQYRR